MKLIIVLLVCCAIRAYCDNTAGIKAANDFASKVNAFGVIVSQRMSNASIENVRNQTVEWDKVEQQLTKLNYQSNKVCSDKYTPKIATAYRSLQLANMVCTYKFTQIWSAVAVIPIQLQGIIVNECQKDCTPQISYFLTEAEVKYKNAVTSINDIGKCYLTNYDTMHKSVNVLAGEISQCLTQNKS